MRATQVGPRRGVSNYTTTIHASGGDGVCGFARRPFFRGRIHEYPTVSVIFNIGLETSPAAIGPKGKGVAGCIDCSVIVLFVRLFQVTLSPEFTPSGWPVFALGTSGVKVMEPSACWSMKIPQELAMANIPYVSINSKCNWVLNSKTALGRKASIYPTKYILRPFETQGCW